MTRLVPVTVISEEGNSKTQPRLGATLEVFDYKGEPATIWFPATVWQGIATLVRQTPDQLRPYVAEFLMVMHSTLGMREPMACLMAELIREVEDDPYKELPETPRDSFDMAW